MEKVSPPEAVFTYLPPGLWASDAADHVGGIIAAAAEGVETFIEGGGICAGTSELVLSVDLPKFGECEVLEAEEGASLSADTGAATSV